MSVRFLSIDIYDCLEYFEEVVASGLPQIVNEHLVQATGDVDCFYSERLLIFLVISKSGEETGDGFSVSSS